MEILLNVESAGRPGRAQRISSEELVIGRSSHAQIQLPNPRVALEHARIRIESGAATLSAVGGSINLNGRRVTQAALSPGDRIRISAYTIEVGQPAPGTALSLTLRSEEPAAPADDPVVRLSRRVRPVSKRRLSYLLLLGVLTCTLVLPLAWDAISAFGLPQGLGESDRAVVTAVTRSVSDRVLSTWNPGALSRSHRTFGANCRVCHQVQSSNPFVSQLPVASQVLDQACLACHRDLSEHVPRAALVSTARGRAAADMRCASCHRDHKNERMVPRLDGLCTLCHADIRKLSPRATTDNVTGFEKGHPHFRIAPVDADTGRVRRARIGSGIRERSNLKFNHMLHLQPAGVRAPSGRKKMKCGDCHERADDERLIAPVSMERHCSGCHSLKFECARERQEDELDCRSGARALPHGPVRNVAAALREFYARYALGDGPPDAGPPPDLPRVRPGAVLRYEDRQAVLAIADRKAQQEFDALFGNLNVCGTCHYTRRTGKAPGWDVAPIRLTRVWMPAARFTHARHDTMKCVDCHDVSSSTKAADIAMPDIPVCGKCHAGGEPLPDKVASDCVTCHKFHGGNHVWNRMLQAQAEERRTRR